MEKLDFAAMSKAQIIGHFSSFEFNSEKLSLHDVFNNERDNPRELTNHPDFLALLDALVPHVVFSGVDKAAIDAAAAGTPVIIAGNIDDEKLCAFLEGVISNLRRRKNIADAPERLREEASRKEAQLAQVNGIINSAVYRQSQHPIQTNQTS